MQFDELLAYPTFWEQIWFVEKIRDRDLPEPVKLHQPHPIQFQVQLLLRTSPNKPGSTITKDYNFFDMIIQIYYSHFPSIQILVKSTAFCYSKELKYLSCNLTPKCDQKYSAFWEWH